MADTYYAWNTFNTEYNEYGQPVKDKTIKPGDTVTANKLGVDEEEWDSLVQSGAVRKEKYPEMDEGFQGSPAEWYRAQAAKMARGEYGDEVPTAVAEATASKSETPKDNNR